MRRLEENQDKFDQLGLDELREVKTKSEETQLKKLTVRKACK
ncbi:MULTISPECIES: hypothetical protein [Borreliella]|nr:MULTISPECIES: hypothetical protein [Borreliella]